MAGIQTSNISTDSGDDLTIDPASGKKTLLKSVDSTNPGQTPIATAADGEVKPLKFADFQDIGGLTDPDADWLVIQDVSDGNKIKKIKASEVLGGGSGTFPQPPFPDPLPGDSIWIDEDSVLAVQGGGSGSTAALQNSVEFAVSNTTYNQSDKNVIIGKRVSVRWMPSKLLSANNGQTVSGTLYAKSGSSFTQTWNLTLVKQPTAGWNLVDLADQPVSTSVTSALAVPVGMNVASPVTIDGGTLTSIQVSVNGGTFTSNPGNIESGQTIAVRGTTGSSNSTGYTALVSIGGLQETWTVTTTAPTASVATPSITSPVNGSADLDDSITALSSAYSALNGAGSHFNSDWELKKAGAVVSSSMASSTNKTSWTIPKDDLEENTDYTIHVRYRSSDSLVSAYSAESSFTTGEFGPPEIGTPIHGGYYFGDISMTEDRVPTHRLIACPVEQGALQGQHGGATPVGIKYKSTYGGTGVDTQELGEGQSTTKAYANISYPMFDWVVNNAVGPNAGTFNSVSPDSVGTGIGGYNDWYVPARHEAYISVWNCRPIAGGTMPRWGAYNTHSCEPYPESLSRDGPGDVPVTTAAVFTAGSPEAWAYLPALNFYWTTSENPGYTAYAWPIAYDRTYCGHWNDTKKGSSKSGEYHMVRCIRRVPV